MLSSITGFIKMVYESNVGQRRDSMYLVSANVVLTFFLTYFIIAFGTQLDTIDTLDIVIESTNVLVLFFMFFLVAMIKLKRWVKGFIAGGLSLMQFGKHTDMLDEFIDTSLQNWHILGDTMFLLGSILLAYGITSWIVYSYKVSTLDKLTNVHNRRYFEYILDHYLSKQPRTTQTGSLLCFDVDDFKKINDKYGHAVGDEVLHQLASILKQHARKSDVICRSGGEEFEVLLPEADIEQAKVVAERILESFQKIQIKGVPTVTASFGVTEIAAGDSVDSVRLRGDKSW
jgi:diguanylate cyclase (GGDEF)-like protein